MYGDTMQLHCEPAQTSPSLQERERAERFWGVLTELSLRDETVLFENSRRLAALPESARTAFH